MPKSDGYAEKAARAAAKIAETERAKTDDQKRRDAALRAGARFKYLGDVQAGQRDAQARYRGERYIG